MARSSEERGPVAGWATAGAAENSDNRAHGIRRSRISTSAEVDPRNRARVAESVNPGSGPPLEGVRYRADELQRLGKIVGALKKVGPTHPHPKVPDHPPLNALLGPGAGIVDRVRDLLTGRAKQ